MTIYEIDSDGSSDWATAVHSYRWGPFTDPNGIEHKIYDYPGLVVDPKNGIPNKACSKDSDALRPHFGCLGLTQKEADIVNSIPPDYIGGNVDDWRFGKGATLYYPVSIDGAFFSVGDTHAAMGDGEVSGTAIESPGPAVPVHPPQAKRHRGPHLVDGAQMAAAGNKGRMGSPWFQLPALFDRSRPNAQSEIFQKSSVDSAMRDAFRKMREFLMNTQSLSEDEAISLMSVGVDLASPKSSTAIGASTPASERASSPV